MKLILLLSSTILLNSAVKADPTALWSVGHGFSQGGVLGVQYQSIHDDNKATVALGLVGAAIGWQHAMGAERRHALGLSAGYEAIFADKGFAGATYNYYPSGFAARGWHFGIMAGVAREDRDYLFNPSQREEQTRSRAVAAFEIGFQY